MEKYHYTECGLDNVYLLNGYKLIKTPDGDEELVIHDIHDLHKVIGMMIVSKPIKLCGNEIRFIRHTLDLSQKAMARLLGVNYQSVLGWEKDKTPISKQTDHFLRMIFFAYLNTSTSKVVYDKINEIADLDAKVMECTKAKPFVFKEISKEWRAVS